MVEMHYVPPGDVSVITIGTADVDLSSTCLALFQNYMASHHLGYHPR